MRAAILTEPRAVESNPLVMAEAESPQPSANQVKIRIHACGVCHTDLHIVEGQVPAARLPLIPGHQIVGDVDAIGEGVTRFKIGERAGVPWLNWIDPSCPDYGSDHENLCENIRFTGKDVDGGFAEYILIDESFAHHLPPIQVFSDTLVAPLLCAGVIGYRALKLSEIQSGKRIALYGFGASAHIVLQIARFWRKEVYVMTRNPIHRNLASELGANWVGGSEDDPPHNFDSAIIFAPVGDLIVRALEHLERGGTVVHAGIFSTPIPAFAYDLVYQERTVRSAANSTRRDVDELLALAAKIPVRTDVTIYPLEEVNRALQDMKHSRVRGAAVLEIGN
jgi:propanol-preferring alcohol dehydrogenase